ncbi:MAG: CRISPR-associated endoribonuclease Cas6 [Moorellales bacterium]
MQLTVVLDHQGPVSLPVHYGHLVQGLIYRQMESPVLRQYLHEQGFMLGKRRFKLFTFSRLLASGVHYRRDQGQLALTPPVRLTICSPVPFILQELGTGLIRQGLVRLGDCVLEVKEMAVSEPRVSGSSVRIRMLSPAVIYSTLPTASGGRYTYYYSPFEPRFAELAGANLAKKYLLVYGRPSLGQGFSLRPLRVENRHLKVTRYKDTIVKGWMGEYELNGEPDLLQLALDAGLGAKNSQGYGCCTLV